LRAQDALLLEKYVKLIKESDFESNKPFYYFEIGNLDIDSGYAESFLVTGNAPSRAKYVVKPWDILVSTVRPERKNIGIVPPTSDNLPLVATSGFSVLRAETPEMAMFIWAYLRSDLATPQLLRWNTGAAYPAIDDDVPLKVLMPNYTHEEMISYGQKWMQIPSLYSCSQKFILAAKFFVEALIEKSLTEVELINASKSSDLDSKLLLGIRTDGYLGSGRQLFDEEELTFLSEIANNLERQED
jgi:type I restriction enzyme S subunit